jgi:DNA polymerase/3'-5' exonuclease PolX
MRVSTIIQAIVERRRKRRAGRGFSREELREVGLSFTEALKLHIPIDTRRSTKHEENVKNLRAHVGELKPKPAVKKKKERVLELSEVKGIGPKTSEKLREARIKSANKLAGSNPEKLMKVTGFSKKRASSIIRNAKALIKKES